MEKLTRRKFVKNCSLLVASASLLSVLGCNKAKKQPQFHVGAMDGSTGLKNKPEEMFKACAEIGMEGIQLGGNSVKSSVFIKDEDIAKFLELSKKYNISLPSVCAGGLNAAPLFVLPNGVEHIKKAVDASVKLGAKNILVPSFGPANFRDKTSHRVSAENIKAYSAKMKEATSYAKDKGITLSMENAFCADDNIAIINEVGLDNLKVYVDTMNLEYYGWKAPQEISKLKNLIGEVHLKSLGHAHDSVNSKPLDMPACIDEIIKANYQGWLIFEHHAFKPNDKFPTAMDCMKYNIAYVKKSKFFKA